MANSAPIRAITNGIHGSLTAHAVTDAATTLGLAPLLTISLKKLKNMYAGPTIREPNSAPAITPLKPLSLPTYLQLFLLTLQQIHNPKVVKRQS